jgi:hypothetical protein
MEWMTLAHKIILGILAIPVLLFGLLALIGGPVMSLLVMLVTGSIFYGAVYLTHILWWPVQVGIMVGVLILVVIAFDKFYTWR